MKRNLGFYSLGNGISVADRNREIDGDFETVAHIDHRRNVKYYVQLSPEDKAIVEHFAKTENPRISTTQDNPVFFE